eukprot:TRINITY_DN207_c0_g1_i5.p1 TRINITY_DN207_c0_g1~~TRINITY_DN207_c0_g1_i5.p1  ORF type:complete len:279 (+),score=-65.75 TRINITY_DN207_c0_g1_i5:292-1128(+)
MLTQILTYSCDIVQLQRINIFFLRLQTILNLHRLGDTGIRSFLCTIVDDGYTCSDADMHLITYFDKMLYGTSTDIKTILQAIYVDTAIASKVDAFYTSARYPGILADSMHVLAAPRDNFNIKYMKDYNLNKTKNYVRNVLGESFKNRSSLYSTPTLEDYFASQDNIVEFTEPDYDMLTYHDWCVQLWQFNLWESSETVDNNMIDWGDVTHNIDTGYDTISIEQLQQDATNIDIKLQTARTQLLKERTAALSVTDKLSGTYNNPIKLTTNSGNILTDVI